MKLQEELIHTSYYTFDSDNHNCFVKSFYIPRKIKPSGNLRTAIHEYSLVNLVNRKIVDQITKLFRGGASGVKGTQIKVVLWVSM